MTGDDFREAIKWSLVATVIVALWCGVLSVSKSHGAINLEIGDGATGQTVRPSDDLHPVWVIVLFEVQARKLIGITEFVFPSYQACQDGAVEAKRELELNLRPVCFLRWIKTVPGSGM